MRSLLFSSRCDTRWIRFGFLLALAALVGCSGKSKVGGRGDGGAAPVLAGKVVRKTVPLTLDAIGAVEPIRTAGVRSQVTGVMQRVAFQEGQEVKEGDLLFEIDPRTFQNALRSAQADLQKARTQLETAEKQLERYRTLNDQGMVSREQYEAIVDAERTARAAVSSSESETENDRLQLEFCSIRAPISGRTGSLGAHEGDLVRASDANISLVTINQVSPIYVTFSVPQQNLDSISHYHAAGPVTVTAVPPGAAAAAETGELSFIDNTVDSTTGTIKLKAIFPNESRRLWPGQFDTVNLTLASPEVLVIPSSAIQNDQNGQHVFVIKADKTVEFRPVTVERIYRGETIISAGLKEGEAIVTDGQLRVIPGKPVEIKDASALDDGSGGATGDGKAKAP